MKIVKWLYCDVGPLPILPFQSYLIKLYTVIQWHSRTSFIHTFIHSCIYNMHTISFIHNYIDQRVSCFNCVTKVSSPGMSDNESSINFYFPEYHSSVCRITEYQECHSLVCRITKYQEYHSPVFRITEYQEYHSVVCRITEYQDYHSPIFRITEYQEYHSPVCRITEYQKCHSPACRITECLKYHLPTCRITRCHPSCAKCLACKYL